jgi:hypothetical protein
MPIMETDTQQQETVGVKPGAIAAGAMLLVVGTAMFLDNSGVVNVHVGRMIGPFVMIAIGASMMFERSVFVAGCNGFDPAREGRRRHRRRGSASSGIWLIGVGCWLIVAQNHLFGLNFHNSWPLFIVLSGIIIVIRGLK